MAGLALDNLSLNKLYIGENRVKNVKYNSLDIVAVPEFLGSFTVGGATTADLSNIGVSLRGGDILIVMGSSGSTQLTDIPGFTKLQTSANIVRYTIQYKVLSVNPITTITGLNAYGSYVVMAIRNVDINSMIHSIVNGESEVDPEQGITYHFNPPTPSIEDLSKNSSYMVVSGAFIDDEQWSTGTVGAPAGHTLASISDQGTSRSSTVVSYRLYDGDSPRLVPSSQFAVAENSKRNYSVGVTLGFRTKAGVVSLGGTEVVVDSAINPTLQGQTVSANINEFDSVNSQVELSLEFNADGTYKGIVTNSGGTLTNVQQFNDGVWFDSSV